jgi:hypothetical protein
VAGRLGAGQVDNLGDDFGRKRSAAGLARLVAQEAIDALLSVWRLPAPNRRSADPSGPRHFLHRQAVSRKSTMRARCTCLSGRLRSRDDRQQTLTVFGFIRESAATEGAADVSLAERAVSQRGLARVDEARRRISSPTGRGGPPGYRFQRILNRSPRRAAGMASMAANASAECFTSITSPAPGRRSPDPRKAEMDIGWTSPAVRFRNYLLCAHFCCFLYKGKPVDAKAIGKDLAYATCWRARCNRNGSQMPR